MIVRSARVIVDQKITEGLTRRILKRIHEPAAAMRCHLRRKHAELTGVAPIAKDYLVVRVQRHGARTLALIIDVLHEVNHCEIAMVRALREQACQLFRVARIAHLVVEHQ